MKRIENGQLVFSPSDLIRFSASPFASWMDRFYLENPQLLKPDEDTEDQKLIAQTGDLHEQAVLEEFKSSGDEISIIEKDDSKLAREQTIAALTERPRIIYQAALQLDRFAGFADFLMLNESGQYQVWDTKLARSPKPYYAIQLCCYSEMLAADTGECHRD